MKTNLLIILSLLTTICFSQNFKPVILDKNPEHNYLCTQSSTLQVIDIKTVSGKHIKTLKSPIESNSFISTWVSFDKKYVFAVDGETKIYRIKIDNNAIDTINYTHKENNDDGTIDRIELFQRLGQSSDVIYGYKELDDNGTSDIKKIILLEFNFLSKNMTELFEIETERNNTPKGSYWNKYFLTATVTGDIVIYDIETQNRLSSINLEIPKKAKQIETPHTFTILVENVLTFVLADYKNKKKLEIIYDMINKKTVQSNYRSGDLCNVIPIYSIDLETFLWQKLDYSDLSSPLTEREAIFYSDSNLKKEFLKLKGVMAAWINEDNQLIVSYYIEKEEYYDIKSGELIKTIKKAGMLDDF